MTGDSSEEESKQNSTLFVYFPVMFLLIIVDLYQRGTLSSCIRSFIDVAINAGLRVVVAGVFHSCIVFSCFPLLNHSQAGRFSCIS